MELRCFWVRSTHSYPVETTSHLYPVNGDGAPCTTDDFEKAGFHRVWWDVAVTDELPARDRRCYVPLFDIGKHLARDVTYSAETLRQYSAETQRHGYQVRSLTLTLTLTLII